MADRQAGKPKSARLDADELSILCEQIALILHSGLPLHEGVEALCENYRHTRLSDRFEALNQEVLETGSLYRGIVAAGIFPRYLSEMAHIGERTGELDTVMNGLALYYRREAKIRHAIVNAVTYPIILIAIMAALIGVLVTNVLPIFEDVFRGMGMDVSTNPWMRVGIGVGKGALIVAGAGIFITLVVLILLRTDRSGKVRAFLLRYITPLRRTGDKISAGRFASVMAMMLRGGFPLDESLKLVSGVVNSADVAQKVEDCRCRMEAGAAFPDAVESLGIFETLHSRMIRVGFQAGQTDVVMQRLAEIYEDEVDDAIAHTVSIIEPSLVALMSVVIGAILLAVMLPLLSLMGGMA